MKKKQVVSLSCYSSYVDFRTLDDTQIPHPSGVPIYIFKSEEGIYPQVFVHSNDQEELKFLDSYAFQTVVLYRRIPGAESDL